MIFYILFFLLQFLVSYSSEIVVELKNNLQNLKKADKKYYDLLGISEDVTESEIAKAFRKKALKYHPDTNKGNPETEEKFKEIENARDEIINALASNKEITEKQMAKFKMDSVLNQNISKLPTIRQKQLYALWWELIIQNYENNFFDNSLKNMQFNYVVSKKEDLDLANELLGLFKKVFDGQANLNKNRFNFCINFFSENKNDINKRLNQTSVCFFLTPQEQIAILYFLQGRLNYCFVSEQGEKGISAYTLIHNKIIKFKLSNDYNSDYIYGDKKINEGIESSTENKLDFKDVFDKLNEEKITTADFLKYLINRLQGGPVEPPKKETLPQKLYAERYFLLGLLLAIGIPATLRIIYDRISKNSPASESLWEQLRKKFWSKS